jgi:hypothetical protein
MFERTSMQLTGWASFMLILQLFFAQTALATNPEITAEVICDPLTGETVISYTSTAYTNASFETDRANPQVEIYVDGVLVQTGAYVATDYSFSGYAPAPQDWLPGDTVTVMALAVGTWGNGKAGGQSASTTVTLTEECPDDAGTGRFTGGGNQIRVDGVRITRGLTIHCDLLLSNNLQINWNGNKFHMTEHLLTTECSDNPDIVQFPPDAPLDTLVGVGTGRYNNTDGYTIEFTLVDGGEPGREDMMAILIYEAANAGNVILDVPLQHLTGGNLQAHYDQPHGGNQ